MKNILLFALMLAIIPAMSANATPPDPPANGGYTSGWGQNNNPWETTTGSFYAWCLWDPVQGDWAVSWNPTGYIVYAPITLELWVEMYCVQAYWYTSYQWHRIGDNPETITFLIEGYLQSNHPQFVKLTKGTEDLTYLYFREDMWGRTTGHGSNLPISWRGRCGDGIVPGSGNVIWPWNNLTPDGNGDLVIPDPGWGPIPVCDHWFQFEGSFNLAYHVDDGYYSLEMAGCPTPEL